MDQKIEPTLTETLPTEALATIDPVTTNNQTDKVIEEVLRSMVRLLVSKAGYSNFS